MNIDSDSCPFNVSLRNKVCKGPQEDMANISEDAPLTSAQHDAVDIVFKDVLPEEIISGLRLRNQDLEKQLI